MTLKENLTTITSPKIFIELNIVFEGMNPPAPPFKRWICRNYNGKLNMDPSIGQIKCKTRNVPANLERNEIPLSKGGKRGIYLRNYN